MRGRSSVKSLPPCHCDPPGRSSGQAAKHECMCVYMCVFVLDWSEEVGTICGIYVHCTKLNDQQVIGPQRPCQCWKADSCGLNSDSHQRRLSSDVTFIHSRFVVCLSMLRHSMLHSSEVVSSCLNMQTLALINSLTPSSVTNLSNTIENGSVDSLTP